MSGFDLTRFNTLGFQASADHGLLIQNAEDLLSITRDLGNSPRVILGCGSNVVIHQPLAGYALINRIAGKSIDAHGLLRCRAGENWHDTVMWTLNQGWAGLENLALIPGTVGASPVQNIGAYGVELKDVFVSLTAWDFLTSEFVEFTKAQCRFAYRDSIFKDPAIQGPWNAPRYLITEVRMQLVPMDKAKINVSYGDLRSQLLDEKSETIDGALDGAVDGAVDRASERAVDEMTDGSGSSPSSISPMDVALAVIRIRQTKLPNPEELGNVGSFFKNPIVSTEKALALKERHPGLPIYPIQGDPGRCKVSAGWMIDQEGFKGVLEGGVGVHAQHALVLVNHGAGKASELLTLAQKIQSGIQARFNVDLESEPSWLPPL